MTLFTISRKKKTAVLLPPHACSSSESCLPALFLLHSAFHKHRKSQVYRAFPGLLVGQQQLTGDIRPFSEEQTHTRAHTRLRTRSHACPSARTQKQQTVRQDTAMEGPSRKTTLIPGTTEPASSLDTSSAAFIKMRGLASTTRIVCPITAKVHSKHKKDRLSPGSVIMGL